MDDIVNQLREHLSRRDLTHGTHWDGCINSHPICALAWALDEIERLRVEKMAMSAANHEAMWDDTLIPIANAFGVSIDDEYGVPRRQFQMVEAIIKEARRG